MSRLIDYANERIKDVEIYIEYNERKEDQDFFAHNELELYKIAKSTLELQNELGCPLDVVFKALKEGIIINNIYNEKVNFKCRLVYKNEELGWYFNIINDGYVLLKDYGKTWWLKGDKQ